MGRNKRGSSLILVITMVLLLAILATGFLYMSKFSSEESAETWSRQRHLYVAKSIHRSVTQAAVSGELDILTAILEKTGDLPGEYTATTGVTTLELQGGATLTVLIDLTVEVEAEGAQAVIDTMVTGPDDQTFQFSVWLTCSDDVDGAVEGQAAEHHWVVRRQYEPEMGVR